MVLFPYLTPYLSCRFCLFCLLFFYPLSIHSYPLNEQGESPAPLITPYEKCEEEGPRDRTNQVLSSAMEAEFCPQCELTPSTSPATQNLQQTIEALHSMLIPKACFAAMAINGNRVFAENRYAFCKDKEDHGNHKGKKLCIDGDYVDMFQKSFFRMARCFNSSPEILERIFLLMNHESGGVLNVLSPSTAKCWGQVTGIYVDDLNLYINSREHRNPKKNSEIYEEASQNCPWIKNTIADIKDLKYTIPKDASPELKARLIRNNKHLTCRSTSDPDLCLFYTFFGLTLNSRFITQRLDSPSRHMRNREFSSEDLEKLDGFPIKRSEMARVKVLLNGKEEKNWLIWDDSELYDHIQTVRGRGDSIEIISAQKVPVFKDREELETTFNWLAHNGGPAYSSGHRLIAMIDRFRQKVSLSCKEEDAHLNRCRLRRIVTGGEGLSIKDVLPLFERDTLANHHEKDPARKKQVSEYVGKIIQDGQNVFSYSGEDNETFITVRKRYENAGGYSSENARNFQRHISDVCPNTDSFL